MMSMGDNVPLYEYKCKDRTCQHKTTLLRRLSERDDPVICEKDGCSSKAEKVLSIPSFHLKGGGWASTGYASTPSVDGYDGCSTYRQKLQRAAEIGDDKPTKTK